MKRVLISFSGGGIFGLYSHAGMLQALQDIGIKSTSNAGTSAGAVIAAGDAAGLSAAAMTMELMKFRDRDLLRAKFMWPLRQRFLYGMYDRRPIEAVLKRLLPATFRELAKPLQVNTTDSASLMSVHFCNGNLRAAVMASMAIQGIFDPVKIDGRYYVDGGTSENLPIPGNWESFDEVYLLIGTARRDDTGIRPGIIRNLLRNVQGLELDQLWDPIKRVGLDVGRVRAWGFDCATVGATRVFAIWPPFRAEGDTLHVHPQLLPKTFAFASKALASMGACSGGV